MCFVLEFHRCISFRPRCISRRIKLNRHRPFLFILRETGKKISRPPSPPPPTIFHGNYGVDGGVVKNPPLVVRAPLTLSVAHTVYSKTRFNPPQFESSWPSFQTRATRSTHFLSLQPTILFIPSSFFFSFFLIVHLPSRDIIIHWTGKGRRRREGGLISARQTRIIDSL